MNNLLSVEELTEEASSIAKEILKNGVILNDSASWITLQYNSQTERYQYRPIGYSLYDGSCGISLFFAALFKVSKINDYRDIAFVTLKSLRSSLLELSPKRINEKLGLGGAVGLGSVIYSLTRTSQFLEMPLLLDDAMKAVSLITNELIEKDTELDVIGGSAGTILGILSLYQITKEKSILNKALACGKHIIKNSELSSTGYKAWPTVRENLLTGFSHGAAGISYALLRLYEVYSDEKFLKAAIEGIKYENSVVTIQQEIL